MKTQMTLKAALSVIAIATVTAGSAQAGVPGFNNQLRLENHCKQQASSIKSNLHGKVFTKEIEAEVRAAAEGLRVRVILPDQAITADFSKTRLNVSLDKENQVTDSFCM